MFKYFVIVAATIVLWGCNKKEVSALDFDVTTSKTTYKVGDSVVFNFSGNPDFITFYSGESGHQYQYANRDFAIGTPQLQFTSYRQYGIHDSTLHLLVSKDFKSSYTTGGVDSASWTDITSKAILSTGTDQTASGKIDLSAFSGADNAPVYLAFKYLDSSNGTSSLRTWTIQNLAVNTILQDSSSIAVATLATAGWKTVTVSTPAAAWIITTTGTSPSLKINGGAAGGPLNYNWVISGGLFLNKVMPDAGVVLKNISARLSSYTYQFSKPGIYNVTFAVSNENIYGKKATTRSIPITVTN